MKNDFNNLQRITKLVLSLLAENVVKRMGENKK